MNSWLVWGGFAIAVVFLGWVAYHFTVRTLRFVTLTLVVAGVVLVTRYGVTHPSRGASAAPVDLVNAFTGGLDNLTGAFFQPLLPGPEALLPGRVGWLVIVVFLAFAYRELEVWAMRWQPPTVDTSALGSDRPSMQSSGGQAGSGDGGPTGQLEYDYLVAQLRFRLPAVEVQAPPVLPGGSTPNELASIAESSGVEGSGLAGAIIRVVGMLWPNPRRYQVRVWLKPADQLAAASSGGTMGQGDPPHTGSGTADSKKLAEASRRVTIDLKDAQTGGSIATTTLAARDLDDAAGRVAAYVARQIFRADPTTPPWSVGSFDGSDLAALISAKQQRYVIDSPEDARRSRYCQIKELDNAVGNSPGAGVARYELALLYDLEGCHAEALRLHALNRRQYPRFFRGRYRLGMSLEMIANPNFQLKEKDWDTFRESLRILGQCGVMDDAEESCKVFPKALPRELRKELLTAAMSELRECHRQLALRSVIWATFQHRDEREVRKPYWRLRERQRFHDGVRVAELLVAVRQRLNEHECDQASEDRHQAGKVRPRTRRAMRIISAFSDDITAIEMLLTRNAGEMHLPRWLLWWQRTSSYHTKTKWRMRAHAGRTRWLPWQRRTPSWEAAYNAACLYAALAGSGWYRQNEKDLKDPMVSAVNSLERVVNDRRCEMERPWDWISKDPDLNYLNNNSPRFREFVRDQGQKDYPRANFEPTVNARAGLPAPDDPLVHTRQASLQNHDKAAQQSLPNSVVSAEP
jgi:hypothetical protein